MGQPPQAYKRERPTARDWVAVGFLLPVVGVTLLFVAFMIEAALRTRNPGIAEGAAWFAGLFGCLSVLGLYVNGVTDRREDPGMLPTPLRQMNDVATWGAGACLALCLPRLGRRRDRDGRLNSARSPSPRAPGRAGCTRPAAPRRARPNHGANHLMPTNVNEDQALRALTRIHQPTVAPGSHPRRIGLGARRVPPGPREGLSPPPSHDARVANGLFFLGLSSGRQATEGDAVPDLLPERPDLDQLRRRAKELRDAARAGDTAALQRLARHHPALPAGTVRLAAAQLVIARELGFPSWPRLIAAVDADVASRLTLPVFLSASIEGRMRQAGEILRADPGIVGRSLPAAAVLGDVVSVREFLAADQGVALALDDERGWPPLLYACYSRWHHVDPHRAPALAEAVRLLLAAGADANTNDGGRARYRSALKGSVEVNNPSVTEVLLSAGAHPDPGQPIAEAAAHRDLRCLRLLLSHGARVTSTWALGAAVFNDNAGAAALLLGALASADGRAADAASEELPDAAATASFALVEALLDAGADPRAMDSDGNSALRLAVRAGRQAGDRGPSAGARRGRGRHRGRPVPRRVPERRSPCGRAVAC
jgi:hypothetical protein